MQRRRFITALGMLSLAGCSLLPDPPSPAMYRLSPVDLDPAAAPVPRGSLAIAMPTAPQNLDTDRIALARGDARFEYFADSTWTDRVPALLQALLVQAFETNGRLADVWTDPATMTDGYVLQTAVRSFTARYAGAEHSLPAVEVSVDLRLIRLPLHRTVGRALIAQRDEAARNRMSSVVQAFDVATSRMLNRSVAWTLDAMRRA